MTRLSTHQNLCKNFDEIGKCNLKCTCKEIIKIIEILINEKVLYSPRTNKLELMAQLL